MAAKKSFMMNEILKESIDATLSNNFKSQDLQKTHQRLYDDLIKISQTIIHDECVKTGAIRDVFDGDLLKKHFAKGQPNCKFEKEFLEKTYKEPNVFITESFQKHVFDAQTGNKTFPQETHQKSTAPFQLSHQLKHNIQFCKSILQPTSTDFIHNPVHSPSIHPYYQRLYFLSLNHPSINFLPHIHLYQHLQSQPYPFKKRRILFNQSQIQQLQKIFRRQKYLSSSERNEVSSFIGLSPTQVCRVVHVC